MTFSPLFTTMTFADADAAIEFLTAVGFEERLVVRDPSEETLVVHAEFAWRGTGGLMFGSARDASAFSSREGIGTGRCYLVTADDSEVDAAYARALVAGGSPVDAPSNQDYGGRTAIIADAEGNHFSIGSYPGS